MCSYNTEHYIRQAVNSILAQTYPNIELIISDDASTDGTVAWLKTLRDDSKVRVILNNTNRGYVANKNAALALAKGEYITQNDSDDWSAPERVAQQMAIIMANPSIRVVGCGYYRVTDKGITVEAVAPPADGPVSWSETNPFWYPSLLVHQSLYDELGYFTSLFEGMGDDYYWTYKAHQRYPVYALKEPMYYYRDNPNSITNVLNKPRKLIVGALCAELIRQRKESGTDWLEQEDFDAIQAYEQSLLANPPFIAEQYRRWAARHIDKGHLDTAIAYLRQSLSLKPFNPAAYRTLAYYIKKKFSLRTIASTYDQ